MRFFTVLMLLFFASQSFAQDDVKGYYVTNNGEKVEGRFKQGDYNNVHSLEFKESSKSGYIKIVPETIKEYGVGKEFKFEKHLVQFDVSPVNSSAKNPQMKAETLFLNVIIEGATTLYSYTKDYNTKFFIKTKDKAEPEQLIYKKYLLENGTTAENSMFRQQLFTFVNCKNESADKFLELIYDRKQLVDIVKQENVCNRADNKEYFNDTRRESNFYYSPFIGLYNQRLEIGSSDTPFVEDTKLNVTAGFEVSYLFKSEIAAVFFRLEYERFSSEQSVIEKKISLIESKYKIDVSVINFMFGPRYNFVALDDHKVFVDAGFGLSMPMGDVTKQITVYNGSGDYNGGGFKYKLKPALIVGVGAGYIYRNRYGIAMRYEIDRDYLDYAASQTKFGRVGLNFSYYFK